MVTMDACEKPSATALRQGGRVPSVGATGRVGRVSVYRDRIAPDRATRQETRKALDDVDRVLEKEVANRFHRSAARNPVDIPRPVVTVVEGDRPNGG